MAVLNALRAVPRLLREQPVLFAPLAIFALLQLPQLFLQSIDPVISILASLLLTGVFIFVTPFFYGGTVGMANDAATGTPTSLTRFWKHAKENYVSVLGAYLLISVVSFGFALVLAFAAFIVIVVAGVASESLLVTAAAVGIVLLLVLAFLLVTFVVHFYAHAIVIDGKGAIGGLTHSVHVVRHNIKSVAGYGLLSVVFGALIGAVSGLTTAVAFPSSTVPGEPAPALELVPAILGSGGMFLGMTLFGTAFAVFSVAFYREITMPTGGDDADNGVDVAGDGFGGVQSAD